MTTYEYVTVTHVELHEAENTLNSWGDAGYECFSVVPTPIHDKAVVSLFFKRPVKNGKAG